MPDSTTAAHAARYYSLGMPGPAIQHIWVCLRGHNQSVAELSTQLVNLDTPERLLILPEAPGPAHFPMWFRPGSLGPDLALARTYLDQLTDSVRAACAPGVPVTVLGYGHGAAMACAWLAGNGLAIDRLILYAAVFPAGIRRSQLFADLPHRPIVVVTTTASIFTSETQGPALRADLQAAGQQAQLRYVDDEGLLTLAALGAGGDAGGLRPH